MFRVSVGFLIISATATSFAEVRDLGVLSLPPREMVIEYKVDESIEECMNNKVYYPEEKRDYGDGASSTIESRYHCEIKSGFAINEHVAIHPESAQKYSNFCYRGYGRPYMNGNVEKISLSWDSGEERDVEEVFNCAKAEGKLTIRVLVWDRLENAASGADCATSH